MDGIYTIDKCKILEENFLLGYFCTVYLTFIQFEIFFIDLRNQTPNNFYSFVTAHSVQRFLLYFNSLTE